MLRLCCLLVLLAITTAAPVEDVETTRIIEITDSGSEKKIDGSYSFHYRGEDGTFREETAVLMNPGTEDAYLKVNGSYSYYDVNGKEIIVHYNAGTHGFVAEGNNIPTMISEAAKQVSELHDDKKGKGKDKNKNNNKRDESEE